MRRISIAGVLAGGVVDIIATNVLAIPVIFAAADMANADLAGAARNQVVPILMGVLRNHPVLYIAGFVGGAMASVLGGYVAARIAKRGHLWNGALSSYLCIGSSIYALATGTGGTIPLWQHIAFLPLSPALGALGGYIVAKRGASHEMKPAEAMAG
ncbi:MAG TPA: hypothetical protein VFK04_14680 [Gemmatimonadaceae bacterium]|nr:hypothetical protein [Gemmatimonadaceae bacterium]